MFVWPLPPITPIFTILSWVPAAGRGLYRWCTAVVLTANVGKHAVIKLPRTYHSRKWIAATQPKQSKACVRTSFLLPHQAI